MAHINKVDLNLGHKIANPFKTTRKSDTNPFKYQDFEDVSFKGNTLQFADVFEGFEPKNLSKMKLISSSVIGSITKLKNSITEPIKLFANRIKNGITSAWDYAKNTNISIPVIDNISESIQNKTENIQKILNYDVGKGITDSISGLGKNISERLAFLNKDVTEIGSELSEKWNDIINNLYIKNIGHEKITSDLPVARLKQLWINENEIASAKSIELKPINKSEVRVA